MSEDSFFFRLSENQPCGGFPSVSLRSAACRRSHAALRAIHQNPASSRPQYPAEWPQSPGYDKIHRLMINIPDTDLKKGENVGVVKKDNLLGFAPTVTNTFEEDNWTSKEVYMGTIITQNGKTLWSDNGAGYTERYAYYAAIVEKRY